MIFSVSVRFSFCTHCVNIQVYKIKSHLKLETFLAHDPAAEWAWHANYAADALCEEKAKSVDLSGHAENVSWISGRAWKLNTWLLLRVRLWLMYKWDKPGTVGEPAQAPKKTKAALFQQDCFMVGEGDVLGHAQLGLKGMFCGITSL